MKKDFCVITYCNEPWLDRAHQTIQELRRNGKYEGDIVVIIGDDLKDRDLSYDDEKVIIKYFPEIDRTEQLKKLIQKPITHRTDFPEVRKSFQWHKIYAFHTYFKQWQYCWGIDASMRIFKPVDKMVALAEKGKFLAAFDDPTKVWKLRDQFDKVEFPEIYRELNENFDLSRDYFQTTTFIYDTDLIDEDTCDLLNDWSLKYFTSKTNDQGVINLFFNGLHDYFKELKTGDEETSYYDFFERYGRKKEDYIMLKQVKT